MRFLCLHGRGTNSDVLQAYLVPLLSRISGEHDYDYVDGEATCKPWPGIDNLFAGPYFAYHFRHDVDACRNAIDFLKEIVNEDGPYDGVIAFSQGAALAVSFLVDHYLTTSAATAPFKIAILICSTMPLSPYLSMGKDRRVEYEQYESSSDATYSLQRPLEKGSVLRLDPGAIQLPIVAFENASFTHRPISIPSFHIIGAKDPWNESSYQAYGLCEESTAKIFVHRGGHELPKHASEIETCAQWMNAMLGNLKQMS